MYRASLVVFLAPPTPDPKLSPPPPMVVPPPPLVKQSPQLVSPPTVLIAPLTTMVAPTSLPPTFLMQPPPPPTVYAPLPSPVVIISPPQTSLSPLPRSTLAMLAPQFPLLRPPRYRCSHRFALAPYSSDHLASVSTSRTPSGHLTFAFAARAPFDRMFMAPHHRSVGSIPTTDSFPQATNPCASNNLVDVAHHRAPALSDPVLLPPIFTWAPLLLATTTAVTI
ncbi:hypothetical protein KSP39_PZI013890 [Platanthera zijinensis]|uniref:Uncharacterized protein n=1 Tax=Platanthera zijinensis TaxID=2320716 RepID=A0AAP0BDH2_9ASPA